MRTGHADLRGGPAAAAGANAGSCSSMGCDYPERHQRRRRVCSTGKFAAVGARPALHPRARTASRGATRGSWKRPIASRALLVDDLALEPGNRVLLRAPNTPMLAACWFAVLKAGGIAVTTMPLYRAGELRFMMEKAQVKHALCDVRLRDELERACEHSPRCSSRILWRRDDGNDLARSGSRPAKPDGFDNVETDAEDVALIAFTSGTTGTPKAAMHYHRDLLAICDTYCARVLQPRSDDLFCGSPPLGFTFGLGGLLLFPLYAGAATLLLEKAGPNELLSAIEEFGVTTLFTAPLAYRAMAACARGPRHLDAAHVRFRRRNAAEGRLGGVARQDRTEDSRWHRQHRDAAHLRRIPAVRRARGIDRARRARLRRGGTRRRRPSGARRHRRAARGKRPDRMQISAKTTARDLRSRRLELPGRCVPPRRGGLLLVRRACRRHDRLRRLQHLRPRGGTGADRARGRQGGRRRREARSAKRDELRQGLRCSRRGTARRRRQGRRAARILQGADRAVQSAARDRVRNRASRRNGKLSATMRDIPIT